MQKLITVKCRGCDDPSRHTHHLSLIGKIKYTLPWQVWREKAVMNIVWRLPRWVAYWSTIRVAANATTGPYASTETPTLTVTEALRRW
jgi:hypothetical protein